MLKNKKCIWSFSLLVCSSCIFSPWWVSSLFYLCQWWCRNLGLPQRAIGDVRGVWGKGILILWYLQRFPCKSPSLFLYTAGHFVIGENSAFPCLLETAGIGFSLRCFWALLETRLFTLPLWIGLYNPFVCDLYKKSDVFIVRNYVLSFEYFLADWVCFRFFQ